MREKKKKKKKEEFYAETNGALIINPYVVWIHVEEKHVVNLSFLRCKIQFCLILLVLLEDPTFYGKHYLIYCFEVRRLRLSKLFSLL